MKTMVTALFFFFLLAAKCFVVIFHTKPPIELRVDYGKLGATHGPSNLTFHQ